MSEPVVDQPTSDVDLNGALAHYAEHGWARLGRLLNEPLLSRLRERADDIMLGRVTYPGMFFQHDSDSGRYEDLTLGKGWEGPSLGYRKIEKMEKDPIFLQWVEQPLFERVARGQPSMTEGGIVLYRAVLFSKSSRGGTRLPWHQDGGTFWGLDRDPELQVWTALDDAPIDSGCVEVISGSHRRGLSTPLGGVVPDDRALEHDAERHVTKVPAVAGEVLLIHNYLWHRSGNNHTGQMRRALTACYMSERTRCLRKKRAPRVFFPVFRREPTGP